MSDPPFPCLTKLWHNTPYTDIDPTKPELSVCGKRIVITGGGTGIGRATARAFATAGAGSIFLFGGRRKELLQETANILETEAPAVKVTFHVADLAEPQTLRGVSKEVGIWDVLVLNAGYLPDPGPVLDADLDEVAKGWTINVHGNLQIVQQLLPQRASDAIVIACSTGAWCLEAKMLQGNMGYMTSKLGLAKMMEIMSAEIPDCRWITTHPGVVDTEILLKSGFRGLVPFDAVDLPAHFFVWLASDEARFLNGKYVWVNWDVGEMKSRADEIRNSPLLTSNIVGWPFGHT